MGQDTFGDIGVSVTLELIYQNRDIICKLLDETYKDITIRCYGHPSNCECDDEIDDIFDFEDTSQDDENKSEEDEENTIQEKRRAPVLESVLVSETSEQFEEMVQMNFSQPEIHFIIRACSVYARNISRRDHPHIFGDDEDGSVEDVIQSFVNGKKKFLSLGVPNDKIKVGYTLLDSF